MAYTFQFKFWWFFQRLKQIESFTCTNCILVSYIFGGEILLSTCRWCCAVHWIKAPTHGAHFCTKLMEFTFYYLFFFDKHLYFLCIPQPFNISVDAKCYLWPIFQCERRRKQHTRKQHTQFESYLHIEWERIVRRIDAVCSTSDMTNRMNISLLYSRVHQMSNNEMTWVTKSPIRIWHIISKNKPRI